MQLIYEKHLFSDVCFSHMGRVTEVNLKETTPKFMKKDDFAKFLITIKWIIHLGFFKRWCSD